MVLALEAFARLVLRTQSAAERQEASRRGGAETVAETINRRLSLWRDGHYVTLFNDAQAHHDANAAARQRAAANPRQSAAKALRRAEDLARQEARSKAANALIAEAAAKATAENLQGLRDLHPARRAYPGAKHDAPNVTRVRVTSEEVVRGVRSFGKMTSGGVTALRAEHLQALLERNSSGTLPALTAFAQKMLNGNLPPNVWRHLAGASLSGIAKPQGGVRPIAAGEVLRRLVSGIAARKALSNSKVKDAFKGIQYGVGEPGGAERLVHLVDRAWAAHATTPDTLAVKIDAKNAFNNIGRDWMLHSVAELCPEIYPYIRACYQETTVLRAAAFGANIDSAEGTQQGDPLGPLLFALAIAPLTREVQEQCPNLVLNKWYLDDGFIMGPSAEVAKALRIIRDRGADFGLLLNPDKCEAIARAPGPEGVLRRRKLAEFDQSAATAIYSAYLAAQGRPHTDELGAWFGALAEQHKDGHEEDLIDAAVRTGAKPWKPTTVSVGKFLLDGAFDLLGAPIGGGAHAKAFATDTSVNAKAPVARVKLVAGKVSQMSAQCGYSILRSCVAGCKLNYLTRTTPRDHIGAEIKAADVAVFRALADTLGVGNLCPWAERQASLGVQRGGLGVRRNYDHADAAFVASCLDSARHDGWDPKDNQRSGLDAAVTRLAAATGKTVQEVYEWPAPEDKKQTLQSVMSDAIDKLRFDALLAGDDVTHIAPEPWAGERLRRARLRSCSAAHAGAFLEASPCPWHDTDMTSDEFRTAVLLRLGEAVLPGTATAQCEACGAQTDVYGYHATTCRGRGSIGQRHNHIRDTFFRIMQRRALMNPEKERVVPVADDSGRTVLERPADILFAAGADGEAPRYYAVDVAVTNPLQDRFLVRAAATSSAAANEYAKVAKCRKYCVKADGTDNRLKGNEDITLMPIVFETFGAASDQVGELLTRIADAYAKTAMISKAAATARVRQSVSVALQRMNARMIIDRRDTSSVPEDQRNPPVPNLSHEEPIGRHGRDIPPPPTSQLLVMPGLDDASTPDPSTVDAALGNVPITKAAVSREASPDPDAPVKRAVPSVEPDPDAPTAAAATAAGPGGPNAPTAAAAPAGGIRSPVDSDSDEDAAQKETATMGTGGIPPGEPSTGDAAPIVDGIGDDEALPTFTFGNGSGSDTDDWPDGGEEPPAWDGTADSDTGSDTWNDLAQLTPQDDTGDMSWQLAAAQAHRSPGPLPASALTAAPRSPSPATDAGEDAPGQAGTQTRRPRRRQRSASRNATPRPASMARSEAAPVPPALPEWRTADVIPAGAHYPLVARVSTTVRPDGSISCLLCGHLSATADRGPVPWAGGMDHFCRGCGAPIADERGQPIAVNVNHAARTLTFRGCDFGYSMDVPRRCLQCCGWHYKMLSSEFTRLRKSPELAALAHPDRIAWIAPVTPEQRYRRRYLMWPFTRAEVVRDTVDESRVVPVDVTPRATAETLRNTVPWAAAASEHGLSAVVHGVEVLLHADRELWSHGVAHGADIYLASPHLRQAFIAANPDTDDDETYPPDTRFMHVGRSNGYLHIRVQGFFLRRTERDHRTGQQLLTSLADELATAADAAPPTVLMCDNAPLNLSKPLVETTLDGHELVACWGHSRAPATRTEELSDEQEAVAERADATWTRFPSIGAASIDGGPGCVAAIRSGATVARIAANASAADAIGTAFRPVHAPSSSTSSGTAHASTTAATDAVTTAATTAPAAASAAAAAAHPAHAPSSSILPGTAQARNDDNTASRGAPVPTAATTNPTATAADAATPSAPAPSPSLLPGTAQQAHVVAAGSGTRGAQPAEAADAAPASYDYDASRSS